MDDVRIQLIDSIKAQLQEGRPEEEIRRDVISQGWTAEEFAQVLGAAKATGPAPQVKPAESTTPNINPEPPTVPTLQASVNRANSQSTLANILYSLGSIALLVGIIAAIYFLLLK